MLSGSVLGKVGPGSLPELSSGPFAHCLLSIFSWQTAQAGKDVAMVPILRRVLEQVVRERVTDNPMPSIFLSPITLS